jgi:hypothetical protein
MFEEICAERRKVKPAVLLLSWVCVHRLYVGQGPRVEESSRPALAALWNYRTWNTMSDRRKLPEEKSKDRGIEKR